MKLQGSEIQKREYINMRPKENTSKAQNEVMQLLLNNNRGSTTWKIMLASNDMVNFVVTHAYKRIKGGINF